MFSRLRPSHLIGATVAYWAGLALTVASAPVAAIWHATHLPAGQGAFSFSYGEGLITLAATEGGQAFFVGDVSPTTLLLWLAGPPLALALAWLWMRGRERRGGDAAEGSARLPGSGSQGAAHLLEAGDADALEGDALRRSARRTGEPGEAIGHRTPPERAV